MENESEDQQSHEYGIDAHTFSIRSPLGSDLGGREVAQEAIFAKSGPPLGTLIFRKIVEQLLSRRLKLAFNAQNQKKQGVRKGYHFGTRF